MRREFRGTRGNILTEYPDVILYTAHLPHMYEIDLPVFLTWRLFGSLPPNRAFPAATLKSGQAFAALDRLLEQAQSGPVYLRQPALADMIVEAIHYNAETWGIMLCMRTQ